jgi:hypothetical protein
MQNPNHTLRNNEQQVIQVQRRGGRGCLYGCLLTLVIIVLAVGVPLFFVARSFNFDFSQAGGVLSELMSDPAPETRKINGDPSNFDPIAGLADAQAMAGKGAQLTAIRAYYVRSDGTMDLNATYTPAPYTDYEFVEEIERPEDAPPVGAGGTTSGQWYQPITIEAYKPGQSHRVTSTGGGISRTYYYTNQGMVKKLGSTTTNPFDGVVEAPQCSFTDLWEVAMREEDAPEDAVAIIEYTEDGYDFNISGMTYLTFDHDCQRVD